MAVTSGGRCMLNTGSLRTVGNSRVSDRVGCRYGRITAMCGQRNNFLVFTNVLKKST